MASRVGSGRRDQPGGALAEVWDDPRLRRALARLERLAAMPEELADDGTAEELARLRYALHVAGERAYGAVVEGRRELAELAAALEDARDATAEVAEALEDGGEEALPLVHEWRGALFRVRLARLRLGAPQLPGREADPEPSLLAPLVALLLTVAGASALVLGATVAAWPIWLAGAIAVMGGLLAQRP